jgi:hypothetical protein
MGCSCRGHAPGPAKEAGRWVVDFSGVGTSPIPPAMRTLPSASNVAE